MRFVNTFIIAMSSVMNYSLFMPYLVAVYAKLNEIQTLEFRFALEVSFSLFTGCVGKEGDSMYAICCIARI